MPSNYEKSLRLTDFIDRMAFLLNLPRISEDEWEDWLDAERGGRLLVRRPCSANPSLTFVARSPALEGIIETLRQRLKLHDIEVPSDTPLVPRL